MEWSEAVPHLLIAAGLIILVPITVAAVRAGRRKKLINKTKEN